MVKENPEQDPGVEMVSRRTWVAKVSQVFAHGPAVVESITLKVVIQTGTRKCSGTAYLHADWGPGGMMEISGNGCHTDHGDHSPSTYIRPLKLSCNPYGKRRNPKLRKYYVSDTKASEMEVQNRSYIFVIFLAHLRFVPGSPISWDLSFLPS